MAIKFYLIVFWYRSVSRNNSKGFISEENEESDHFSDGDSASTANLNEVEKQKSFEQSLTIEEKLKILRSNYAENSRESEEHEIIEHMNINSASSVNSSRTNSGHSSCPSTDTSSVVMNRSRQDLKDLEGVTDHDINQLREWLDCNKLDSTF